MHDQQHSETAANAPWVSVYEWEGADETKQQQNQFMARTKKPTHQPSLPFPPATNAQQREAVGAQAHAELDAGFAALFTPADSSVA